MMKKPFYAISMLFLTALCFSQSLNVLNQGNPVLGSGASTVDLVQNQDGVYYLPYILNGTLGVKTSANGESFGDGVIESSLTEYTAVDFKVGSSFGSNYLVLLASVNGANHLYLFALEKGELRQVVEGALDSAGWSGVISSYQFVNTSSAMIVLYVKSGNLGAYHYNPDRSTTGHLSLITGAQIESFNCQQVSKSGFLTLFGLAQSTSSLYQFELTSDLTFNINSISDSSVSERFIISSMTGYNVVAYKTSGLMASALTSSGWKNLGQVAAGSLQYQPFMLDKELYTLSYRDNNGINELVLNVTKNFESDQVEKTEILVESGVSGKAFILPQSLTLFTIGILKADGTVSLKNYNCSDGTLVVSNLNIDFSGNVTKLEPVSYSYGQQALIGAVDGVESSIIEILGLSPGESEPVFIYSRNVTSNFSFRYLGKGVLLLDDDSAFLLFNLASEIESPVLDGTVILNRLSISNFPLVVIENNDGIKIYVLGDL